MERRDFVRHGGLAGILAAGSAPAIAQSLPEVRWRMASSFPKALDTLYGAAEFISRRVGEITGGRFRITPSAAGEIVPGLQVLDAVQQGSIESAQTAMYYFFGKNPAFAFGTCLPFGPNYRQQNAWWYHGGGEQMYNDFLKAYGCVAIAYGNTGTQMGGWFRKEIKSMDDMRGLKFRVGGVAGVILQRLGVVPQQIAGGDIYPALEKGTIDAAEWVGPHDDEKLGFNKVARYYYAPGWWEGNSMGHMIVAQKAWDSIPKEYQMAFTAACGESNAMTMAKYDSLNPIALKKLVGSGTQLRVFPKAVLDECRKAALDQYAEWSDKFPEFKKLYEPYNKFHQDQIQWFRVAEDSYDTYVMRANS
ncbi:MAG TPA: TRAP transporter substrate-binding protein DctP [Burkholderiaceae bacterium]|nr:TRAP transporter substrate-binding protein DctP [Burkholderiaceae bacterium]